MGNLSKKKFNWIMSLLESQSTMLKGKDEALLELYNICDTEKQKALIKELLLRFNCFEQEIYNLTLIGIAKYVKSLNYPKEKTAIVAFCNNTEADSSQEVLQDLKIPIAKIFKSELLSINRFDKILSSYTNKGIRHFIAVDEFTGSGKTIISRNKNFTSLKLSDATIDYCLIAGMEDALNIAMDNGLKVHIEYVMKKGINGYYRGERLKEHIKEMKELESKLAKVIDKTQLNEHNFGYGHSESLYTHLYKNIPNNVFPIFWWKKYENNNNRVTLFDRVQNGY